MKYRHTFLVNAPLNAVAEFHSRSASMGAITPPPVRVALLSAPPVLQAGDEMDFVLHAGPFRIPWLAEIENVSRHGFTDRQVRGPFEKWEHRHSFLAESAGSTRVVDEITWVLKLHPWWLLVGLVMAVSLPVLFSYRATKTRRLLAQEAAAAQVHRAGR